MVLKGIRNSEPSDIRLDREDTEISPELMIYRLSVSKEESCLDKTSSMLTQGGLLAAV